MLKSNKNNKSFSLTKDFYKENHIDNTNYNIIMGIEFNKNTINKENYIDKGNVLLCGKKGSGKTNIILNILYQLYDKEFLEFYIIDKGGNLSDFMNLENIKYYNNISSINQANIYLILKILYTEALRRKNLFNKYNIKTYSEYIKKYNYEGLSLKMQQLNHITVIFEEYEFIRKKISKSNLKKFDEYMTNLIYISKSMGIKFIITSFSILNNDIGKLSIQSLYISEINKNKKDYFFSYNGTDKLLNFPNLSNEIGNLIKKPSVVSPKQDLLDIYKNKTISIINENYENGFF